MPMSDRAAALGPYLQTLLYDREVQDAINRAMAAGRETFLRARGKSPGKAIKDKRLRDRAQEAVAATLQVWAAMSEPEPRRRPRWGRRLVVVTTVAAGVYVAANAETRQAVLGLLGRAEPQPGN